MKKGRPKKDLTGKKFGNLTVLGDSGKRAPGGNVIWTCLCSCGTKKDIMDTNFKSGETVSCGCIGRLLSSKRAKQQFTKHGHSKDCKHSKTYSTWHIMKQRCLNPNYQAFEHYGGRGIKVCERWMKFENFLEDMGERPKGKTIERKNNYKGYEPNNCKWATHSEQMLNRRPSNEWPSKIRKKNLVLLMR